VLDGLKVLVADDQPAVVTILERVLPTLGTSCVVTVPNGSSAIDAINAPGNAFDCVIADIYMQPGTGLQLLHAIRNGQVQRAKMDLCFVLMTGKPSAEIANLARELDVNGFIAKPFTPQSLGATLVKARRRVFPIDMAKYARVIPSSLMLATQDAVAWG
jgi:two-component system chemotaxis response regulator CheY